RIALGVLVGEHGAEQGQHFRIGVVLGGDEFDAVPLSCLFAAEGAVNGRVGGLQLIEVVAEGGSLVAAHGHPPCQCERWGCPGERQDGGNLRRLCFLVVGPTGGGSMPPPFASHTAGTAYDRSRGRYKS